MAGVSRVIEPPRPNEFNVDEGPDIEGMKALIAWRDGEKNRRKASAIQKAIDKKVAAYKAKGGILSPYAEWDVLGREWGREDRFRKEEDVWKRKRL